MINYCDDIVPKLESYFNIFFLDASTLLSRAKKETKNQEEDSMKKVTIYLLNDVLFYQSSIRQHIGIVHFSLPRILIKKQELGLPINK